MQKHQLVEKKKVYWDGEEKEGLVRVADITLEKSTVEVPSFKRIRILQSDITKLPAIEFEYLISRDSDALKFFEDFYNDNQVKDCVISRTDAHGDEFARRLWQECECIKITEPAYDAANPTYAKITVTVVPWERVEL